MTYDDWKLATPDEYNEATPDEFNEADEAECLGHDSTSEPAESQAAHGYPRTIYCDGSCRRQGNR